MIDAPPSKAPSAPDEEEERPILPDPYHVDPPPPGPPPAGRARLAPTALGSVLAALLLGPLGAILAVFLGVHARRQIAREGARRSGGALAVVGIVLGALLVPGWALGLSYVLWTHLHREDPTAGDDPEGPPSLDDPDDPDDPSPAAPSPQPVPTRPGLRLPPFVAPPHTRVTHEGRITIVDLGMETTSVPDELARQRAEASTEGETLLVMTTAGHCDPCRGVDHALADPLLQNALAKVRLLRVDIAAFHEDLEALRIPDERIPGFFLLSLDLTPRDGIDGGEWDADIPVNIAPVLGAFVRGKHTHRREPWHPVPGSGMSL